MSNKEIVKKKVSVFLQTKGGVGKSFLGYFKMLGSDPQKVAVVLLDSSQKANQNKTRHARILGEQNVKVADIYNAASEYKKSHFFQVFEDIAALTPEVVILDVGAPESNVLREALEHDEEVTGENLHYVAEELGMEIIFNVVVSGADDNVNENIDYFAAVNDHLKAFFPVNMLINDVTFKADGESERMRKELVEDGLVTEDQIRVVGKSGSRNNDNAYLEVMAVANGDKSLDDAKKNMSARIRLRNILEPLASV